MAHSLIYSCLKCGAQYPKWQGRCLECGSWGTIQEQAVENNDKKTPKTAPDQPIDLKQLPDISQARLSTKIQELDRVLGGGIVKGSLILIGGDPGVGKSTLCLQISDKLKNVLYVSGEESGNQVKIRAQRINLDLNNLRFLAQTDIGKIIATIEEVKPELAIVDSIQTMRFHDPASNLGSAAQIISITSQLLEVAKKSGIPIIIIGHVTKEGLVAGPKSLEHLVDTVLYLENDNQNFYKILCSSKNRFGSTGEIGVFEMTDLGLKEVSNPSQVFLEKENYPATGAVVTAVIEGQRPFFLEVQALVTKTVFGYPQRKAAGFDLNRLQLIIAVISKIAKLNLNNQDIYLNIAGGLKIKDPGVDLAVATAIISAFLELPVSPGLLIFGELGLAGEIRSVPQMEKIISEALKLNFEKIVSPPNKGAATNKTRVVSISDIRELVKIIGKKKRLPTQ
ncbi:MAG: DNA repair protein RadA [Patescibacteria group bacterium]